MRDPAERSKTATTLLTLAAIVVITFLASLVVIQIPPSTALLIGVCLAIFVMAFFNMQAALYFLIFAMLLSPELGIGGGGGASQETARGAVLRLDDFLLVLISFSWLARMAIQKELGLLLKTPLNRPILAYTLAFMLATFWGILMGRVRIFSGFFFSLKYAEYFVIYFMVANNLRTAKQARFFIIALLATASIVAIIAMAQIPGGGRVTAPFEGAEGEPNTLGGYLVLMSSVALGLAMTLRDRAKSWLMIGLVGVMFIPILFTLSRGSWVAIPPMIVTLILYSRRRGYLILGVVALALFALMAIPAEVLNRVLYTFQEQRLSVTVAGVTFDPSTTARLESYYFALRDVASHPILGFGVTGYRFLDAQFIKVLADTGLFGLITFLWLIVALFRSVWSSFRAARNDFEEGVALGCLAGLVAMVVHAFGANTFIIVRIMEPFWFLMAIVTLLPTLETDAAPMVEDESVPRLSARGGTA